MGGTDQRPLAIAPAAFAIATREVGKTSTPAVPCAQIAQTVRKLPEFGVKQREERAVRESERWASSAA